MCWVYLDKKGKSKGESCNKTPLSNMMVNDISRQYKFDESFIDYSFRSTMCSI